MTSHRYSAALRRVAPHLAAHAQGLELLRACAQHERSSDPDPVGWDVGESVYWIGSQWHGGQSCPLYAALCATEFEPGACWRQPEPGSSAAMLADVLEAIVEGGA